ncbi:MAG: hypothetical protein ACRDD1_05625, partial [Planctomycetia bacterium]
MSDVDGSESLTVTLVGVPDGASFTQNGVAVGSTSQPGVWNFDAARIPGLQFVPPPNFVGDAVLNISATNIDQFFIQNPRPGRSATPNSVAGVFTVTVFDDFAVPPLLTTPPTSGVAGRAISLSILASSADLDGSETVTLRIAQLPAGSVLSKGTDLTNGMWSLTLADLAGLTLTVPKTTPPGVLALEVTALSTESNGGATAETVKTLSVDVLDGFAELPLVSVQPASGSQDQSIPLVVSATSADPESQTIDILVRGLPPGSRLSAGVDNGNGSWTVTPQQLVGLAFTPPPKFFGALTLTVVVRATEATGDASEKSTPLDVVVAPSEESRPLVTLTAATVSGVGGQAIPLGISVVVPTGDAYRLNISGVPATVQLSAGIRVDN